LQRQLHSIPFNRLPAAELNLLFLVAAWFGLVLVWFWFGVCVGHIQDIKHQQYGEMQKTLNALY